MLKKEHYITKSILPRSKRNRINNVLVLDKNIPIEHHFPYGSDPTEAFIINKYGEERFLSIPVKVLCKNVWGKYKFYTVSLEWFEDQDWIILRKEIK